MQVVLSGFGSPYGPFGVSFDRSGKMYFIDHGTGGVYSYDFKRPPKLLATATSLGGTFTGKGFQNRLFFCDVNLGYLLRLDDGGATVFASDFAGKGNPPHIGPH